MVEGLGEVAQVLAFGAEVGHQPRLVLRAQLGVHVDDARFRGQGGRGGGVVTGQHRHPVPGAAQPVDDLGGLGTQLVTHRDRTDDAPIVLDEHRGGAHLLHALDVGGQLAGCQPHSDRAVARRYEKCGPTKVADSHDPVGRG